MIVECATEHDHSCQIPHIKDIWAAPNTEMFEQLSAYVSSKLEHGGGEAIISIGSGEDEDAGLTEEQLEASMTTLRSIGMLIKAEINVLRTKTEKGLHTADVIARKCVLDDDFMEVRVAVVGNVDSGKSTLLGVLTHGHLDDGRGTARLKLFRHKHEKESGRTSSVGNDILGFDKEGKVVNKTSPRGGLQDWAEICRKSSKVITFIDLAGHEKYLKTTVFGLTGYAPDYCMLMVGSNMGIVGMTKEHLGLAVALNVPVFVVITKIDICPENVLAGTLKSLTRLLKRPGCRKLPLLVNDTNDAIMCALRFTSERLCPIFQVSNVRGDNLELLRIFLNLLSVRKIGESNGAAEFQIDDLYSVPGVGTIVSGTMLNGKISVNDMLNIGPDRVGAFKIVQVKSIHRKRMPVTCCVCGQTASFSLKKVKRSELRKGMVLLSTSLTPICYREFEADLLILHHPTTISVKYQAMVHIGSIRQTAAIVKMSIEHLRTGDRANVRFRFLRNAEYMRSGQKLVFREGRTKAIGTIREVFPGLKTVDSNNIPRDTPTGAHNRGSLSGRHKHH